MSLSNYPPGVTGNEPMIAGGEEIDHPHEFQFDAANPEDCFLCGAPEDEPIHKGACKFCDSPYHRSYDEGECRHHFA